MAEFVGRRFTVPKHLGIMVASDAKPDGMAVMKPDKSALEVLRLTKRFDRLAVDSLDLTIHAGEFYALVGPNGAGKTTTLRMVAGLLRPDAGAVGADQRIEFAGVNGEIEAVDRQTVKTLR